MTFEMFLFLVLGAAAGGFINGLSGTGTALFALGFYLVVLEPIAAVAIVAVMSVLAGLQGLWVVRAAILARPKRLLRFLIPGLIGIPFGIALLARIDADVIRIGIAVFLILYGGYFSARAVLPSYSRPAPVLDAAVGLVGGILGGAVSVSGAIPAMWVSLKGWPKAQVRAVLQPFNVVILSATAVLLVFKGAFDETALRALFVTVPVGLIAAQLGIFVFKRLSDGAFQRLLIGLTLLMGVGLLVGALF